MDIPRPHDNTYWVEPGRFLAGEYPADWTEEESRARLRGYLEAGVSFFLDLTEPRELEPYDALLAEEAAALGRKAEHTRMPVPDLSVPTVEGMREILDTLERALAAGHTAYVHCWGGVGRTGTVVGCYLVRSGRTGEEALAQIAEWWDQMEKRDRHPRSPEMPSQVTMIKEWTG